MATKNKATQVASQAKKTASAETSPNVVQPEGKGSLAQNDNPDLTRNQSNDSSADVKEKRDVIAGHWVRSKQDGFRRAGIAWSVTPTFIASGELTEQQIDALQREPMLEVVEGEI